MREGACPQSQGEGWQAQLTLDFACSKSRTMLVRSDHQGPLRVQRAFYPEGDLAHMYLLHPPGGVVGGDALTINVRVDTAAQVLCTTPGSGKFYRSAGSWAILNQHLRVSKGASLEWLPQENILFAGARLRSRTHIELEADAVFMGWEVNCLGRPSSQEPFHSGAFDSRLMLYHNQRPILVENQRVFDSNMLKSAAGLRGFPLQGTLLAFPCTESQLDYARRKMASLSENALAGLTLIDGLLVMRILGNNSETLKQHLVSLWKILRPLLLDRPAVLPRIWAT
ncbi:MAG TPA: urease accessory protein [Gammaproteobacteria bacterium]|nr:urease accessory protein [Gammaproteobacteria bacterium]